MGTLSVDKLLRTSAGAAEFTLPATDGTVGQVMQTDGSGQLSIAALAADTVGTSQLSATGTASATTFLRGDNAWAGVDINGLTDALVENNSIWLGNDPSGTTSTASENVAVGTTALDAITTADSNVAIGYDALTANTTGANNAAIGHDSLAICTGASNTALGQASGALISSGGHNTAIGRQALGKDSVAVTGSTNTALGSGTGNDVTSGGNNTFLGYNSGDANSPSGSVTTGSNQFCLGDNSITDLFCADTSISSSDQRDKVDITDFTHGLSFVKQLRPVTYKWDKRSWYAGEDATPSDILAAVPDGTHKKSRVNIGLIAQEVQILEQQIGYGNSKEDRLVTSLTDDGVNMGLKYERIVPILVNAIKELSDKVDALESA